MDYLVIDCETNIKNRGDDAVGKMWASPWHPDNKVVWWGGKDKTQTKPSIWRGPCPPHLAYDILVGHNIKFDLHYMWKERHEEFWGRGMQIWDTMIAEYLLTGQEEKFASLDHLSKKYGGTIKDDTIKEYWDSGVDTEDIPEDEIVPYLEGDVMNTELIFLAQVKEASKHGMLPLIMTQMEAVLATAEMEWNGMYFNKRLCSKLGDAVLHEAEKLKESLIRRMEIRGFVNPSPTSNQQVSVLLFGGTVSYTSMEDVLDDKGLPVVYKTGARAGKVKRRKCAKLKTFDPWWSHLTPSGWKTPKGEMSVADSVIQEMLKCPALVDIDLQKFLILLKRFRKVEKDFSTYFKGYAKLVWETDLIHPSFNHCSTNTGRLSSSAPNFQNVSGSE